MKNQSREEEKKTLEQKQKQRKSEIGNVMNEKQPQIDLFSY